jgi:hypothetical protein
MRFMIFRKADAQTEAGVMPTTELIEAMGRYMEEMAKAGVLLAGEGLKPSSKAVRVKFTSGKPTLIDGPFAETKELVAGYCLIEAKSLQEAIDWMKKWPTVGLEANVELEIRPLFEAEDFGPEFTPEQRQREEELRQEIGSRK